MTEDKHVYPYDPASADANAGRCLICQEKLKRKGRGQFPSNPSYYCSWNHWHDRPRCNVKED